MKSAYYAAVVTNAYRMGVDAWRDGRLDDGLKADLVREVSSVSHREYCTGYYNDDVREEPQLSSDLGYIREKAYIATACSVSESVPDTLVYENENGRLYKFIQRNKMVKGSDVEVISPGRLGRAFTADEMYALDGTPIESAPHPSMLFYVRVPFEIFEGDIIRGA